MIWGTTLLWTLLRATIHSIHDGFFLFDPDWAKTWARATGNTSGLIVPVVIKQNLVSEQWVMPNAIYVTIVEGAVAGVVGRQESCKGLDHSGFHVFMFLI